MNNTIKPQGIRDKLIRLKRENHDIPLARLYIKRGRDASKISPKNTGFLSLGINTLNEREGVNNSTIKALYGKLAEAPLYVMMIDDHLVQIKEPNTEDGNSITFNLDIATYRDAYNVDYQGQQINAFGRWLPLYNAYVTISRDGHVSYPNLEYYKDMMKNWIDDGFNLFMSKHSSKIHKFAISLLKPKQLQWFLTEHTQASFI